jgi:hypothetical protein
LAWGIGLLFYAVAAVPELAGSIHSWNGFEFKIYYLFGGVLLVPWLSLGTAELLLPDGPPKYGYRASALAVSAFGLIAVTAASLHGNHLGGTDVPSNCAMWCSPKSETGYALANGIAAIAAAVGNIVGLIVLIAGAGFSAYRTYRAGLPRELTLGNAAILVGALIVGSASSLTRLGSYTFFYAGQAVGIAIIFAGFLVIGSASAVRGRSVASGAQPA